MSAKNALTPDSRKFSSVGRLGRRSDDAVVADLHRLGCDGARPYELVVGGDNGLAVGRARLDEPADRRTAGLAELPPTIPEGYVLPCGGPGGVEEAVLHPDAVRVMYRSYVRLLPCDVLDRKACKQTKDQHRQDDEANTDHCSSLLESGYKFSVGADTLQQGILSILP